MRLSATLVPVPHPLARRHYYTYDVIFAGERVVCASKDPETDLARHLLAKGIKGKIDLFDTFTGKHRSTVNIEAAAKVMHVDGDRKLHAQKYRSFGGGIAKDG
jgi:hypothetical protein